MKVPGGGRSRRVLSSNASSKYHADRLQEVDDDDERDVQPRAGQRQSQRRATAGRKIIVEEDDGDGEEVDVEDEEQVCILSPDLQSTLIDSIPYARKPSQANPNPGYPSMTTPTPLSHLPTQTHTNPIVRSPSHRSPNHVGDGFEMAISARCLRPPQPHM